MSIGDYLDVDHAHPPSGPQHFIRRVKANQKIDFVCYSKAIWGCWTHWDGRRSHPHLKRKDLCMGCKHGWPKRWKGYLDCFNVDCKQREFVEVTPGVCEFFDAELPAGESLQGQRFELRRGAGDKARFVVTFRTPMQTIKPNWVCPQPLDPKQTLLELWQLNDIKLSFGDADEDGGFEAVG